MIRIFEQNETSFTTLGLGVLKDAIACVVKEELNGSFELELEYPITGQHYDKIGLRKILFAKPNMYDREQPFRIYAISKPLNGIITINAEHISYDTSGYLVMPFNGENKSISLDDTLLKIKDRTIPQSPFDIIRDPNKENSDISMESFVPISVRSILSGSEGTIHDTYGGEFKFDIFDIILTKQRGSNKGFTVRYGKNMTELEQEISSEKIYSGIFPFYFKEINETKTTVERYHQRAYIINDVKPFYYNWLASNEEGKVIIPIVENVGLQIVTEGEYFKNVVVFKRARVDDPLVELINVYEIAGGPFETGGYLSTSSDGDPIIPKPYTIYKVISEGTTNYKKNIVYYDGNYELYSSDGFYIIPEEEPVKILAGPVTETVQRNDYVDLKTKLPETNGIIFINGHENDNPKKILSIDLSQFFSSKPEEDILEHVALDYIIKNNLTELTNSIKVSFIKLSESQEYKDFSQLENVQLGDIVGVIYEKLGVNDSLRVISTSYDALSNRYSEIELGKKSKSLADGTLQSGDPVSSLKNDSGFTDNVTVQKIVAQDVNASYIYGKSAELVDAIINNLQVQKLNVPGLIEASYATIDNLVAQLLTAENAEIKNVLSTGELKVRGDVDILSGSIKIGKANESSSYVFEVDREGNLTAESVDIRGGIINVAGWFYIDETGLVTATKAMIDTLNSKYINTESIDTAQIKTTKILFDDEDISIQRYIEEGVDREQKINLSFDNVVVTNNPNSTLVSLRVFTVGNKQIYKDKDISVSIKFLNHETNKIDIFRGTVTLLSGTYHKTETFTINENVFVPLNPISIFPTYYVDIKPGIVTKKLIAKIDGVDYTLAGSGPGPALGGVKIIVSNIEPDIGALELINGDFWYEYD